ncbi:MAG: MarR family winged helix-turn-helix transcriptional regulator [Actinomycetes bacterium]
MELLQDVGFLLSRCSGLAVRATNARLAPLGLRVRHYSVLSVASEGEGITQRELAEVLGLDPSQVVALVDDLQDMGLVQRLPDPRDRRTRLVVATGQGEKVRKTARKSVADAVEDFLGSLGDEQRAALARLLQQLAFPGESTWDASTAAT